MFLIQKNLARTKLRQLKLCSILSSLSFFSPLLFSFSLYSVSLLFLSSLSHFISASLLDDNDSDHWFSRLSLCSHSSDLPCVPECVDLGTLVDWRIARSVQKISCPGVPCSGLVPLERSGLVLALEMEMCVWSACGVFVCVVVSVASVSVFVSVSDAELRSSPSGTPAPRSTECITTLPTPKSLPTVGLIRVVLCQRFDSQQLLTQYCVQLWRSFARITAQAPNSLPTLTTGTCGSNHNSSYRQLLLSQLPPDQSTLLYSPPRHKCGKPLARTPIPPEFQDKVTLTLCCLGGHLQIHGDTEPSPVVLGEQVTMEKTTQRFQKIATTLGELNAEGLNAQAVNDLLTMYVGAASQHVLRMSFVPEQEVHNFDRQVITYWSRLMHRDIASPLFFLPLKLGGLGVGSAVQRHAAAPWRAWQSIIPLLMATTQSPDTDSLFSSTPLLRAQLTQLQSTPLPTNEQTHLPTQTTWSSPSPPNHPKETCLHQPKEHPQTIL